MLLVSCQGSEPSSVTEFDFSQIEHRLIEWNHLFEVPDNHYYALVYSLGCQHCLALEDEVVSYALKEQEIPLFFIRAADDIPRGMAIEETVGATSIEEVFILGWPTLLEIQNDTLIGQSVGEEEVRRKLS